MIINTPVFFNNVPEQRLTYANQLTVTAWNDIINTLRTQANAIAMYIKRLDYWFFDENNPDNWYARVEQHLSIWHEQLNKKVNIGTSDDPYTVISYYGLKNKIDAMSDILYVLNSRPFEEIWYGTNEPNTSQYLTWVVDADDIEIEDILNRLNNVESTQVSNSPPEPATEVQSVAPLMVQQPVANEIVAPDDLNLDVNTLSSDDNEQNTFFVEDLSFSEDINNIVSEDYYIMEDTNNLSSNDNISNNVVVEEDDNEQEIINTITAD